MKKPSFRWKRRFCCPSGQTGYGAIRLGGLLLDTVSLAEAIYASGSIDQFLLASKEWVTG
jgi:hypothetical protein